MLRFQPRPRAVVMCDFSGFIVPEMVKIRPVVVLARNKENHQLVTVVPLSTTRPHKLSIHHHELSTNPLPDKPHTPCWAKCDMVSTVSVMRLDRYRLGVNHFVVPEVSPEDFKNIRAGVASALDLADNLGVPERGLQDCSSTSVLRQPGRKR